MAEPEDDPDSYTVLMQSLERQGLEIVKLCMAYMEKNTTFTWANMFGWSISGRSSALNAGFRSMIEQRNILCALPIVRMQLDNVLRLYAGFFADDPQEFCLLVQKGERIDKMKSFGGYKMNDSWLVSRLSTVNPWMQSVYETTSGYIHLSGKHMDHIVRKHEDGKVQLVIGPTEHHRSEQECTEPMRCMRHLNDILAHALDDWFTRMCGPDGIKPHPDRT